VNNARTVTGQPKRPKAGGYARGDETRQKVIDAGLDVFGSLGLEAASTRAIAQRAGVNLPALHYYFGGKDGLYRACADHIADRMELHLQPAEHAITEALARPNVTEDERRELLHTLLDAVAEVMVGSREPEPWVRFIIREQASPTPAFDVLYDRIMSKVIGMTAALLGSLLHADKNHIEIQVRAMGLVGQLLFFRTARETALRTLEWTTIDSQGYNLIKSVLRDQTERALIPLSVR
jgi:TetR/AcrR family transcriptional regulator, regulator of cefoperazone and chloramphenicol sensitivity